MTRMTNTAGFALAALLALFAVETHASGDAVLSREPAPDAPQGVKDLQVLIGDWECGSSNRQEDGTWEETPYRHQWKWYYTLEGRAVQDYWLPDDDSPGVPGTNLRMFDEASGTWFIAWSTVAMNQFEDLSATWEGDEYVLTGHKPAGNGRPEHDRRITFHAIGEDHFDWKYEARGMKPDAEWSEMARLSCDRQ